MPTAPPLPFDGLAFDGTAADRRAALLARMADLTAHHRAACPPYARILAARGAGDGPFATLADVPFLPVPLFKQAHLSSVPDAAVVATLASSGTGGVPSRVVLDRATAGAQGRALAAIVRALLGSRRLPMAIVDGRGTLERSGPVTARAAAVAGFGMHGRDHLHLLGADGRPDWDALAALRRRHPGETLFLFGFTFLVWTALVEAAARDGAGFDLAPAVLLHGGGWKRLADRAVDAATFRAELAARWGIGTVRNYYGLAEQAGSIVLECAAGRLHASAFSDALARDPVTLAPLPTGETGVLQLFSTLPESYPGHALLTEDLGAVTADDGCPCGWRGPTLRVDGRLPKVELRGCSDARP
jgi:hypothetical protein